MGMHMFQQNFKIRTGWGWDDSTGTRVLDLLVSGLGLILSNPHGTLNAQGVISV